MSTDLPPPRSWSTGAAWLDGATGALRPGDLWVLTGRPGQGKSAVLIELAVALVHAGASAALTAPNESMRTVRDRLRSALGERTVDGLDLWVDTEGCPEDSTSRGSRSRRDVALVDDAHEWDGSLTASLIAEARRGAAVVVTVPFDHVVEPSGDLVGRFAEAAAVVVEVRTIGLAAADTGYASVQLLKNRRGPLLGAKHLNRLDRGHILRAPQVAGVAPIKGER